MTRRALVLVGGGEHARVVAEAAVAGGAWEPTGYTDLGEAGDRRPAAAGRPLPFLGTDEELAGRLAAMDPEERPWLVVGFGGTATARRRAVAACGAGARWAVVVHPAAWVSPTATLGAGSVVLAGAVVNAGAVVGDHAIVNSGAVVEHDVRLGEHVHVAPGATIGGGATLDDGAFVGLGAIVRDHVRIGVRSTVAMGAVVVADVADDTVVAGVPARVHEVPSSG